MKTTIIHSMVRGLGILLWTVSLCSFVAGECTHDVNNLKLELKHNGLELRKHLRDIANCSERRNEDDGGRRGAGNNLGLERGRPGGHDHEGEGDHDHGHDRNKIDRPRSCKRMSKAFYVRVQIRLGCGSDGNELQSERPSYCSEPIPGHIPNSQAEDGGGLVEATYFNTTIPVATGCSFRLDFYIPTESGIITNGNETADVDRDTYKFFLNSVEASQCFNCQQSMDILIHFGVRGSGPRRGGSDRVCKKRGRVPGCPITYDLGGNATLSVFQQYQLDSTWFDISYKEIGDGVMFTIPRFNSTFFYDPTGTGTDEEDEENPDGASSTDGSPRPAFHLLSVIAAILFVVTLTGN